MSSALEEASPAAKLSFQSGRSPFHTALRRRVEAYFAGRSPRGGAAMAWKVAFYFALFFGLYALVLFADVTPWVRLGLAAALGVAGALLTFNVAHDAVHGALSHRRWVNRLFGYTFNLIGLNAYTWWLKHDVAHHNYPNVVGVDPDIELWPLLCMSPRDRVLAFHRVQHLYAPLVYAFTSLFLTLVVDFRVLFDRSLAARLGIVHAPREYAILFASKTLYLGYVIVVPMLVLDLPFSHVLIGFVAMHVSIGLVAGLLLLPSHATDHARFESPDENGRIHADWAVHQLATTIDFAAQSRVANFVLGGFNTNVVHHLFPRISHRHYVALSRIVADTAREHGVAYHGASTLGALRAHFRFLSRMGRR